MTVESFLLFLFLSFAVGRITRFIVSDDLWLELREAIVNRLQDPRIRADQDKEFGEEVTGKSRRASYLHEKLATLLTCAWCVSIYISALVLIVTRQAEIHFGWGVSSIPLPIWYWLGLSMVAVLQIEYTDGVKEVRQVK